MLGQVTALGPPNVLERASTILAGLGNPTNRGAASARLREVLAPHLAPGELASFDAMVGRLDALTDAVVAKVQPDLVARIPVIMPANLQQ